MLWLEATLFPIIIPKKQKSKGQAEIIEKIENFDFRSEVIWSPIQKLIRIHINLPFIANYTTFPWEFKQQSQIRAKKRKESKSINTVV